MAYKRGLLTQTDLSEIQEKMLLVALNFEQEELREELEYKFEQELLIHRPESYQKYLKSKEEQLEENFGYDEIVWSSPDSEEEARKLMEIVSQAHKDFEDTSLKDDEEFNQKLEALSQLKNIDINLLGDDDG